VAVNVSVRQFRHPDFVDMVMATIARTGIPPHRLKLELTESLLADRMEITIAKMGSLRAIGVTLAIDDFGMGYSSLSVLKRLPLDQLKIDRSFVADLLTDPNDAAISRAIITLAQSLGLGVVAEGVETQAQRDFLIQQGCEHFQGYLFSEPLPIAQLEAYLRRQDTCPASSASSAP
jgi:EAL domain-containing protein (putative c-di-GMP-specific phosphodiesterase class I)